MAQKTIVYWRDIPAQVLIRAGRRTARRELPLRFIEAIDRCAMRVGARDSDAYLEQWRRGDAEPVGDDLEQEAETALAALDSQYPPERLKTLIGSEGYEHD